MTSWMFLLLDNIFSRMGHSLHKERRREFFLRIRVEYKKISAAAQVCTSGIVWARKIHPLRRCALGRPKIFGLFDFRR